MRSPRHRPGTRVPSPAALAPPPTPAGDEPRADRARRAGGPRQPAGEHHDPGRELAAPRLFVLAVDCELRAGASPAAAPAAALTARAGGPARGHPAAAPVTRTLRAVGLFPGGMLAVRRAREPGHSAAARPANQATGFQPPTGMSLVTVPSSPARQEPRQRGVVSSPAIRAGGVPLASAGGSPRLCSLRHRRSGPRHRRAGLYSSMRTEPPSPRQPVRACSASRGGRPRAQHALAPKCETEYRLMILSFIDGGFVDESCDSDEPAARGEAAQALHEARGVYRPRDSC